jgi:alanyl-tRNA synthetase
MPTERLYLHDAMLLDFEATVVAHARFRGAPSLILDRTAFYPESGGQMADRGTLGGVPVRDVQLDGAGEVHHLLAGALPPCGSVIRGSIDAARRRTHMALHTGQHLLSRALVEIAGAETTSSRLGESVCTIDVDCDAIPEARIAEAEALVNAIIDEDRPVRTFFPDPDELRALPLRRPPRPEHGRVRVVDAGGFDCSPCGGTHVTRTAQIGLVRVIGTERYKGGTRISFSAGARARRELLAESASLREIARLLGCSTAEAPVALARLRDALEGARQELGRSRASLARRIAAGALAAARGSRVVAPVGEGGIELVRQVAAELTREGDRVAVVFGPVEGGVHLVVARGPANTSVDARAIFAAIAKAAGGRGGGRPERAEGRILDSVDLRAVIDAALGG